MIEAIREIGKLILEKDKSKMLENLTNKLQAEAKGKKQHIIIVKFDTVNRILGVDFLEIRDDTPEKFLWVGNNRSRNPQIFFTTNNLEYILSQTFPNIINRLEEKSNLREKLNKVLEIFYCETNNTGKCKYLFNLKTIGINDEEEFKNDIIKEECKSILKEITSKFYEYIKSEVSLSKNEISLFTVKIDDELMVENEEYKNILIDEKMDKLFSKSSKVCSLCNTLRHYTDRPKFAGSALGYYITDQKGFSSDVSSEFFRNFLLCDECYQNLLVGETYVRNKLKSRIGGLNIYIIPKFLFAGTFDAYELGRWSEYIVSSFNCVKSIRSIEEFNKNLDDYKYYIENKDNYIINLLFWKTPPGQQSKVKVLKLIKDVPPSRFDTLSKKQSEINDTGKKLLDSQREWRVDLENIYYLIPLRRSKRDISEYKKIVDLYDCIFSGKPVSYNFLINQFIELFQIYRFDKFDVYNVGISNREESARDIGMVYTILRTNLLILYFLKLNLIKGGEKMDYDKLNVSGDLKDFIKEMGYDETKTAMFLTGNLIGEIGNAQIRKGTKKKPVLGKIIFQGMGKPKLIRLLNEVVEKLIEYDRLTYNEITLSECKRLMDKNIDNWNLSDQENVFYILSGYAYATHRAITGKQKEERKEE